jgi:hypothetical protein
MYQPRNRKHAVVFDIRVLENWKFFPSQNSWMTSPALQALFLPPKLPPQHNSPPFYLFFCSASKISYPTHAGRYKTLPNKCFTVVKMRPLRHISPIVRGSRPFRVASLEVAPLSSNLGGAARAWRGLIFSCQLFKHMPSFRLYLLPLVFLDILLRKV